MYKLIWSIKACGIFLLWAATAAALPAQTFTTLHSFEGTDGSLPVGGLVQASNGDLYGTASFGADNARYGTVYKLTPGGTLTTLLSFDYTDGDGPSAALIQATDGEFYGTTPNGGTAKGEGGTVFKITASGTLTTLHNFCSQTGCPDGLEPLAGLVQATDGNFYGTTCCGGANGNWGTIFKLTPGGTLTTLHSFDGTDGYGLKAGLVQATNGKFYGTTADGGATGYGTVFEITPDGKLTTLYNFCSQANCTDGFEPFAGLVQATDGNFYGTTEEGGANRYGTVFTITPSGVLTTLFSFDETDGAYPVAGLVQATDGNFYGTTSDGGANGDGTIFNITPAGALTTLHNFDDTDGEFPVAGLVQGTNGNFYGTTSKGGANNDGAVYALSVGLGPFVKTNPAAGKVGAKVGILGTDLTGATSVTFNGSAAEFTVKTQSLIIAKVPSGANTGTVQVQLPSGTLSSNVPFIVLR